jgi:tetratricopeptide (TPR) repeat protein
MNKRATAAQKLIQKDFQAAFSAHQAGRLDEAQRLYLRVLRVAPADGETLYLLGTAFSQGGDFEQAKGYLEKALALCPGHRETINNLGLTWKALGKPEQALALYRRALAIEPDYADAHNNAGQVLEAMGKLDEAETHLRRAVALHPGHADGWCNLGLVMRAKDRLEEAASCFQRGLQLRPDHVVSLDHLGDIYKSWGRFDAALACLDRALSLQPDSYSAHNSRGGVLEALGRFEEALAEYERAAQIAPDDVAPRWNQSFLFLSQGMLGRGWEAYRLRMASRQVLVRFPFPEWEGEPLDGKTVLIYAEQGLGDEILFASCFDEVIARAGRCVIECTPRLAPLFGRSFPAATVVGSDRFEVGWLAEVGKIDVQVAAGSLPRLLRPTIDSFPDRAAYLQPDPQRLDYWRSRLALLGPGLKVGICWRSGVLSGERRRLYPELTQWGEIFRVPGVHFVNLQYGECGDELRAAVEQFGVAVTAFDDIDLRDQIDESAALTAGLDLVISPSTAVLEMAGALGVEAYTLNNAGPLWTALGRSDASPWHPRTRLFEQTPNGDWDTALALAAVALGERAAGQPHAAATFVSLPGPVEVAVAGSLDDLACYVLLEQQQWFDAEAPFVLGLAVQAAQVVDVGAGVGAYALPVARALGSGGRLFAYTSGAAETDLLMRSRARNGLEARLAVAIAEPALSLDAQMDQHGLDQVVLVRIDAALCRRALLDKGQRFFDVNSPLLMFGIDGGAGFDETVPDWLLEHGYQIYRLVPGLGVLAPCMTTDDIDVYTRYLFACKPERAAELARQGLLAERAHALGSLPGIELPFWQHYLGGQPCAAHAVAGWIGSPRKDPDWEVYWMALNLFAMAKSDQRAPAERVACLDAAASVLVTLLQEHANLPRLVSLCRILSELGKRAMAVGILNQICDLLDAGMSWALDEPLLALADADAGWAGAATDPKWVLAMVLAQREHWRAFSTYFTGQEALPALLEVRTLGYAGDAVERRIGLIESRFGTGR